LLLLNKKKLIKIPPSLLRVGFSLIGFNLEHLIQDGTSFVKHENKRNETGCAVKVGRLDHSEKMASLSNANNVATQRLRFSD